MPYYTRLLPYPLPGRCSLCGQSSAGLWCDGHLEPYQAAGDLYNIQPDANVITVRRAPENGGNHAASSD